MKFKVGDKVRIRKDLEARKYYCMADKLQFAITTPSMVEYRGEIATICAITNQGFYVIDVSPYHWTDEMFEPEAINSNDIAGDHLENAPGDASETADSVVASNKDVETSVAWSELEMDLLTSLTCNGSGVKSGDAAKKLYALGYRKRNTDTVKVKCQNCEFYDAEKARCDHPQLDWDDSVSAVWLSMGPDDFCSHGKPKKPEDKPVNYSGKIVCVECKNDAFVPGKMYDCADGRIRGEDGELWGFVRKPNNDKSSIFCLLGSETDPLAKFITVSN